eukprot:CAMPEP_0119319560 /NCGR_PEP_ID=MMETSP1333-20130426/49726_1 /TAXON_ID=418940 /ORGANISM="Scyphosphaera apsteinii, Strain RCC1455" /LENGTH=52 /DNA_ID=CAMNT_0007325991 /DNA_START=1425 /DNA_END=1583 /DNA_ORIENTATION=-
MSSKSAAESTAQELCQTDDFCAASFSACAGQKTVLQLFSLSIEHASERGFQV